MPHEEGTGAADDLGGTGQRQLGGTDVRRWTRGFLGAVVLGVMGSAAPPAGAVASGTTAAMATRPSLQSGAIGVTVGVVSFTASDGLAAVLHAGHHYRTKLFLVVSPGYDGSTATVTVRDGVVEGCAHVPLPTAVGFPLNCRLVIAPHARGRPPPSSVVVTVTVAVPGVRDQQHEYVHALLQTRQAQG